MYWWSKNENRDPNYPTMFTPLRFCLNSFVMSWIFNRELNFDNKLQISLQSLPLCHQPMDFLHAKKDKIRWMWKILEKMHKMEKVTDLLGQITSHKSYRWWSTTGSCTCANTWGVLIEQMKSRENPLNCAYELSFTHRVRLEGNTRHSPGADCVMSCCLSKSGAEYIQVPPRNSMKTATHVCKMPFSEYIWP